MLIIHSKIDDVKFAYNSFLRRYLAKKSTEKRNGAQYYKSKQYFWSLIVWDDDIKILECIETSKHHCVCLMLVVLWAKTTKRRCIWVSNWLEKDTFEDIFVTLIHLETIITCLTYTGMFIYSILQTTIIVEFSSSVSMWFWNHKKWLSTTMIKICIHYLKHEIVKFLSCGIFLIF